MDNHRTRIAIILDRSGSMASIEEATIRGFNELLGKLKASPGTISVKLVQFDDEYETVFDLPLLQAPLLTRETFVPRGMTALLDAQGRTIVALGEELRNLSEAERPGKVIVMTMTDGLENASQVYTANQIARMVEQQRSIYSWQFVYLGANQDATRVATRMGIPATADLTYNASRAGVANSFQSVSACFEGVLASLSNDVQFSLAQRRSAMAEDDEVTLESAEPMPELQEADSLHLR